VWNDSVVDGRGFGFTLVVTVACILLAGVAPALEGLGTRVAESLKASAQSVAGRRSRLRYSLMVLQAALSVVLLIGAGLFVKSLRNVVGRDVGIDLKKVLLVRTELPPEQFARPVVEDIYRGGLERISALPGVASASVIRQSVPTASGSGMAFRVPGTELVKFEGGGPYYGIVSSNFFETLGTSIIRGRAFTPDEDRVPTRSMIINKQLADGYWPNEDPIGKCARLGSDSVCSTVVGVVENVILFSLVRDDRAMLYIPPAHVTFSNRPPRAIVVRPVGDPATLIPLIQREMQAQATNMPYVTVEPFHARVQSQLQPWRLGATMFTLFGVIALVIATVGLYSVLAFWVSQRQHEIGVRMALGAQKEDVIRLVVSEMTRPVLVGLALGTVAAAVASRWIVDLLYETSPRDPLVYGLAALALAIAAALAAIIPARRSVAVDPAKAIRTE
jgi:putative ABC transport system permease protein